LKETETKRNVTELKRMSVECRYAASRRKGTEVPL